MSRFAKKFRVISSLCALLNFIALFLPITKRIQENYADLTWTQLDYIQGALADYIPFFQKETTEIISVSCGWVLFFMVLPLVLSLIAGIWGFVGSYAQKISGILVFLVLMIYIGMAANISYLWPEAAAGQEYCRGSACMLTLIFSGCAAVWAVASLAVTPRKRKTDEVFIPQVEEIKQEQVEAKYNIVAEENRQEQAGAKYNIVAEEKQETEREGTHGALVGRTGIYAGAEIPLEDGDVIRLGRQSDNHLIFEGQLNVSRNHCQIKWDNGRQKYVFRDYSSNGSFVNGSEDCLPQNLDLELDPGTTIAIGDEMNTFYLK